MLELCCLTLPFALSQTVARWLVGAGGFFHWQLPWSPCIVACLPLCRLLLLPHSIMMMHYTLREKDGIQKLSLIFKPQSRVDGTQVLGSLWAVSLWSSTRKFRAHHAVITLRLCFTASTPGMMPQRQGASLMMNGMTQRLLRLRLQTSLNSSPQEGRGPSSLENRKVRPMLSPRSVPVASRSFRSTTLWHCCSSAMNTPLYTGCDALPQSCSPGLCT